MTTIANIAVALIALLHIYILVLEMFLWGKPAGLRAFGQTPQAASASRVLAANQGLYNGLLAAGLFWGLWLGADGTAIKIFFLGCVLVAGLFGAATASPKILFVQARTVNRRKDNLRIRVRYRIFRKLDSSSPIA
jgi:putative membrane protein